MNDTINMIKYNELKKLFQLQKKSVFVKLRNHTDLSCLAI